MKRLHVCQAAILTLFISCAQDPSELTESKVAELATRFVAEKVGSFCFQVRWPTDPREMMNRGWATEIDCTPPQTSFIPPLPCRRYDPTPKAQAELFGFIPELTTDGAFASVCHAKATMTNVLEWTPPAQVFGETVSTVKFEYAREDIAPWVKHFGSDPFMKSYLGIPESIDESMRGEMMIRLTSNGWTFER